MGVFPEVERVEVGGEEMAGFTREREFTGLAFDLLQEAASYVTIAACVMGEQSTWGRDRAVVGGHLVRIYKLLYSRDALLNGLINQA